MKRALPLVAIGLWGCWPLEGSDCNAPATSGLCIGNQISVCENGNWVGYPCSHGCETTGRLADGGLVLAAKACRFGAMDLGKPCPATLTYQAFGPAAACGSSRGTVISCESGIWQQVACRGEWCTGNGPPSTCTPGPCGDVWGQTCR